MHKHYQKLIGFYFVDLNQDEFRKEEHLQIAIYGKAFLMLHEETDTLVLLETPLIIEHTLNQTYNES